MIDTYIGKWTPAMMFGPQEVLLIVIVTAIVVFFMARGRRRGK